MKKNLTIIAIALLVLAMAIPASAASLSLDGALSAEFKYKHYVVEDDENDTWKPSALECAGKLELNLTFKEGEGIVAYLPLTATMDQYWYHPVIEVGSWYFSYATAPWAFWASKNDEDNAKQFASLGDPLGLVATVGEAEWAMNAKGSIVGANLNLYAIDYCEGAAWLGRATYGLPMDFQLGLVGAYADADTDYLVFGADVTGKIPGIGADLTLAGAGSWNKIGPWKFEVPETNDNYAFMAKLANIKFDPVSGWVKYTAVGDNFGSDFATYKDGTILKKYAKSAAAEVEISADLPVGIPTTLTLGDTLWMDYPTDVKWNETTGKAVVNPLENLAVTVSGAYKADLDTEDATDYKGYKVHGDVAYKAFGLTLTPYAEYLALSYADAKLHGDDAKRVDTIVGMKVSGDPLAGLNVNLEGSYQIEEPKTALKAWGVYTTELNPGFVKSAKTQIAGFASYNVDKAADTTEDPTAQDPKTDFYAYAGSDLGITDNLTGKVGILTKDSKGTFAAHAALTYKASDSISTALAYTYRHTGLAHPEGSWEPFADEGKNFLQASVTGTVGKSTIKLAYGVSGLKAADTSGFHAGKAWAWLRNYPANPMDWQLLSLTVKVPF